MSKITDLLGANADDLLNHTCKTISKDTYCYTQVQILLIKLLSIVIVILKY